MGAVAGRLKRPRRRSGQSSRQFGLGVGVGLGHPGLGLGSDTQRPLATLPQAISVILPRGPERGEGAATECRE